MWWVLRGGGEVEGEWGGMGNVGGGAGAGEDKVSKNGCGRLGYCLGT